MKNNIYIFSNSILSRKNNSLCLQTIPSVEPAGKIDIYEGENEGILLPAPADDEKLISKNIPAESVESIFTFGEARFNTQFFKCMNMYEIAVHIFNYYGNYVGSFIPAKKEGSGKIQILQYKSYTDDYKRLFISKAIIEAAVKNMIANLKSYLYSGIDLESRINSLSAFLEQIRFTTSISELMGFEGMSRTVYYESWNDIFKQDTGFDKRIKRPPIGMANSLISFGNALLYGVCLNEIYRTRLNPFIGYLHETGDNKHPLVYDISEIFKPVIVDKVIFRCINLNMITEEDFQTSNGGYLLKDKPRKKFVEEFESRLSTVIQHNRLNRKVSYRSLIRMECYNLINYLQEKIKNYEPYRAG